MYETDDLDREGTYRNCNGLAVPVFKGVGLTIVTVADEVSAGGAEFLASDGPAGCPAGRGCLGCFGPCVQRAYSVDVCTGVAAGGLPVSVGQAAVRPSAMPMLYQVSRSLLTETFFSSMFGPTSKT